MYLIIVYDVHVKRVGRICKYLRRYLTWIQNSVFEGELTEGQITQLKLGLKRIIKDEEDSVLFYYFSSDKWLKKEFMGLEKNPMDNLL
jgi:CRISPR-associated protein Cas2